jgi:two-component system chemotaxis sensor kinase CheA
VSAADDDATHEFLVESYEHLDRVERELLVQAPSVDAIFRSLHTIKGTAGFFGYERIGDLAHAAESLLDKIRDGELALVSSIASALLDVVDALRLMLAAVEQHGHDDAGDHAALVGALAGLQQESVAAAPVVTAAPVVATSETTIRVDVELLDELMDLAGELVLARNQLLQRTGSRGDALAQTAQRIDRITSELHDGVMRTRMQPIGGTWSKLPRIVRDLAGELGKQVRLELDGSDTGLDRSIIEAIRDPLTHVVRNAIDHGIEKPDARVRAGKPAEGVLRLRASHEGGHVMLEVSDDGAGIDPARVRAKALERGVVGVERAAQMTDTQVIELVFEPGFSTADTVTAISGRGVGMDVVKHNIERIGGVVAIDSRRGAGTTMRIKLPLTLAIVPALIVDAGGERYAIAQVGVRELVRLDDRVEHVGGAPVYRLRGELLPLLYLDEVLGGDARTGSTIVVLEAEGRAFGLVVDAVHDSEEIVVKPVGARLRDVPTYAGATILGDGRIALILDVRGIAARAGLGTTKRDKLAASVPAEAARDRWLVVEAAANRRLALAANRVIRIEPFDATAIELARGAEVVQYAGKLLPLVRLADDPRHIVVCTTGSRAIGLVTGAIVDIFDAEPSEDGVAVIAGRVTDVIDVTELGA